MKPHELLLALSVAGLMVVLFNSSLPDLPNPQIATTVSDARKLMQACLDEGKHALVETVWDEGLSKPNHFLITCQED